ncbi:S41 family peptidase [Jatrophihabitans sp.]|uniref:S41 family peptidase n=1 Tax=Jatrophihabitans sp. TaxID=1932789 RepID=UPI002C69F648|nr:PDZ domain-containing protein [Jatrophihabitans sp.]
MTAAPGYLRFPHLRADLLTFVAENDVWLAGADGGPARRLTADAVAVARPRLSPDGTLLAWTSRRRGEPEVFVMPVAGGPPRQLTFFGVTSTNVLGFAPDGRLLVMSSGSQAFRSWWWAYAIDVTEGADPTPRRLPYGPVTALAVGEPSVVVSTGYLRDPAHWKRYRGGTANRLWLDASGGGEFTELLAELPGPKTSPVWTGGRLAFLADAEGHGNVYSVAADGSDLRRHTDHGTFYARQLAGDGSRLVYQHAGQIWRLDSLEPDSQPRRLDIELGSSRSLRASTPLKAADHLGALAVDSTGRASAIEIRGNIVWLTHRNGPARVVASRPGVRHRLPAVLADAGPDGQYSVAYVTDAEGEDAVEIADGSGTRRYGTGRLGRVLELVASPDGTRLAAATHDGRLLTIATADGTVTELEANPNGDPRNLAFSPDSAWLAYSAAEPTGGELRSIRLAELAGGRITAVTSHRFLDTAPVFTGDGKYLAFLSARTFDPVYDAHVFDLVFPLAVRPYLVTLAADTPSPFDPELQGRGDQPPGAAPKPEDGAAEDAVPPVRVDLEGLADRVEPFPVPAGRLADLRPARGGLVWTDSPVAGELGESRNPDDDIRPSLQRWDFGKRKQLELAARIDDFAVSGNGAKLVVRDGKALSLVPADRKPAEDSDDAVPIDLDRIRLTIDPPAEWRQMVDETGRLMRDHYWIADMAGIDWDAQVAKYRPLVDQLGSRDDLSDLLWEINGETGSSHAYETPPATEPDAALAPAFLGADLERTEQGQWQISRIIAGDNSSRQARSPLQAPGVGARPGDLILAVNGRPVGPAGPAELLRGTANKPVELRLSRAGVERSVVVRPLAKDTELRYLDWVASRRAAVHRASDGRIGYVHVPDMVPTGWAAFHRDLRIEIARDALLVDTRDNNGGHTSQLIIEKLARRVLGWSTARHYPVTSYPSSAPRGPLASLANEWAGSDGDIVNTAFQAMKLGPVIGTRTWGGVIGIDGRYKLVDGTDVTQPRYSYWFENYGWGVENHGVDPDIVVELPPHAWGQGSDPQLQAGIDYLLGELDRRPAPPRPDLSQRPSRRAPELPPRGRLS